MQYTSIYMYFYNSYIYVSTTDNHLRTPYLKLLATDFAVKLRFWSIYSFWQRHHLGWSLNWHLLLFVLLVIVMHKSWFKRAKAANSTHEYCIFWVDPINTQFHSHPKNHSISTTLPSSLSIAKFHSNLFAQTLYIYNRIRKNYCTVLKYNHVILLRLSL